MTEFLANHTDIQEEDEPYDDQADHGRQERRDSEHFQMPNLDEESRAKLLSCMDEIRGILGDATVSDKTLVETIMRFDYDCAKALDHLLSNPTSDNITAAAPPTLKQQTIEREVEDEPKIIKGKHAIVPSAPLPTDLRLLLFSSSFICGSSEFIIPLILSTNKYDLY